jgi:hypothetical protein
MFMSKSEALIFIAGILQERWVVTHDDNVGKLNGCVLPAGRDYKEDKLATTDPGAWEDWEIAIKKVTSYNKLDEIQAKKAMIELMKEYNKQGFHLEETISHFHNELIPPTAW